MTAIDPAETGRLQELATEAWDGFLSSQPVIATALGDRRFDDRLSPNGPGADEATAERIDALLRRVRAIDATVLSDADRVTRDALVDFLGFDLNLAESRIGEWSVDPIEGPQVALLNIPSVQSTRDRAEAEALVARWREMGDWVDRHVATSRDALRRGVGAPAALARSVGAELDDLLARPTENWPLLEPASHLPDDLSAADRDGLAAAIGEAVATGVRPAFERYRAFLADELGPVARGDDRPGLSHLPGGAEAYARLVRAHTTLDLGPEEIHRIGLEETARIDDEFAELGSRVFGTADRAAVRTRLRTDPAMQFASPEEVLAVAEASLARANGAIAGWFGRLPRAECIVVEMGEHEALHSTVAYYLGPAADRSRPGSYYINTLEPATQPRYEAEVLAFHEAVPGHHLQIAIAQELDHLPAFRRLGGPTAYIEGWGLYSERLSEEMGLLSGETDRFGVLSYDAYRACRLVVDTGLHALGWSRDRAIAFLVDHTALAEGNIVNEVDRYLAMPGQALAYKLGQLELLRLRERADAALGPAFDIRAFHDVVLGQGAVGLKTLARVVEEWSTRQQ